MVLLTQASFKWAWRLCVSPLKHERVP